MRLLCLILFGILLAAGKPVNNSKNSAEFELIRNHFKNEKGISLKSIKALKGQEYQADVLTKLGKCHRYFIKIAPAKKNKSKAKGVKKSQPSVLFKPQVGVCD